MSDAVRTVPPTHPAGTQPEGAPRGAKGSAAGARGADGRDGAGARPRVAVLGNPNTGKTTLFNRLTGLRHKTSNFPGTTLEARLGQWEVAGRRDAELVDLPGVYSLELEQLESEVCREVLAGRVTARGDTLAEPDGVLVVLDGTNLARNLVLAGEVLRRRLPTVVAVNMIDLARRQGLQIDAGALARALGCPVVLVSARTGEGVEALREALGPILTGGVVPTRTPPGEEEALRAWADDAYAACATGSAPAVGTTATDRMDAVVTHPVWGVACFAAVMSALFFAVFSLAQYPMGWIEGIFELLGGAVEATLPAGLLHDLLKDGVVAGVGSTVIFLPQICLLFFLISLLEDTGYLARGAFVLDRALRPFGLPGHAFVPFLSAHACALPGIMAARCIPDRRQRLATILATPFMTCSARLPVYVLLIGILFPGRPLAAGLAFVGCYALGMAAGMLSALLARRTLLRGPARPMALELPTYKLPSVRTALLATYDRALVFLKKAGTAILAICIVLWWLGAFPHVAPPAAAEAMRTEAAALVATDAEAAARLEADADHLEASHAKANSFLGRIGRAAEPVFEPLGYDWRLAIGVMASFAAREVFVSTMAVVVAGQEEGADEAEEAALLEKLETATRDDGRTPIFSTAAAWSLLVFYVLAMQCLPTLAVTAREAGHVKWALLQLAWMSAVAYGAALVAFRLAAWWGGAGGAGGGA